MSLVEAIRAAAQQPHSIQARAALASALEPHDAGKAAEVWEATAQIAARRGQFFTALFFGKAHLKKKALARLYEELGRLYSQERSAGERRRMPPLMLPRSVQIPESPREQRKLALKLGTNVTGIALPRDAVFPRIPLFGDIPLDDFRALAQAIEAVPVEAEQVLLCQGDREQAVYLLSHGEAQVSQKRGEEEVELACVRAPALFGEISLLTHVPRRATVRALRPGLAWRIDGPLFESLEKTHPSLGAALRRLVERRLIKNMLRAGPLFANLSASEQQALLDASRVRAVMPGEEVIAQGAEPSGLYVILHGEAEVRVRGEEGASRLLARLSEGEVFGEFSLLTGERTTAGVSMPQGGTLCHLSPAAYETLRQGIPRLEETLREQMTTRQQQPPLLIDPISTEIETLDEMWIDGDTREEIDESWFVKAYRQVKGRLFSSKDSSQERDS